eukprot:TRINITY_DN1994_c0_g1_i4.p2 TRINITY_DN1994_c0_g1~~TRINITY_DN1994_c0_g1_i4.p2  ORF type:complete len:227 (-),score=36.05 TRINITY_DN1994_c0_g1_i4:816-1496(-)
MRMKTNKNTKERKSIQVELMEDTIEDFDEKVSVINAEKQRPFVTLTYAQSLDGCISAERGKPLVLSGEESMRLTHHLRMLHDGILVGVSTIQADNPSLNVRLVDKNDDSGHGNPIPIVMDRCLRIPADCKLFTRDGCEKPIVVTVEAVGEQERLEWEERRSCLEALGGIVVVCDKDENGYADLDHLMSTKEREEREKEGIIDGLCVCVCLMCRMFIGAIQCSFGDG